MDANLSIFDNRKISRVEEESATDSRTESLDVINIRIAGHGRYNHDPSKPYLHADSSKPLLMHSINQIQATKLGKKIRRAARSRDMPAIAKQ